MTPILTVYTTCKLYGFNLQDSNRSEIFESKGPLETNEKIRFTIQEFNIKIFKKELYYG